MELYASIAKKYLLDSEFYGEQTEIEFVEAAVRNDGKHREVQVYSFQDLEIWDDYRIARHLNTVEEALGIIEAEKLVKKKRRPLKDSELPLFS